MELFTAHRQWSKRPADERFETVKALYEATKAYAKIAAEKVVSWSDIRLEASKDDIFITGKAKVPAMLTHWAFGQLCQRVEAPASYLRDLPATLAVQNLNHGLANNVEQDKSDAAMLFHRNGNLLLRAIMTERYERIWNYEVAERLLALEDTGWEPARPDIRQSLGDFPALYASGHDMFAFMRKQSAIVREPGNPDGLQRGVI